MPESAGYNNLEIDSPPQLQIRRKRPNAETCLTEAKQDKLIGRLMIATGLA